MDKVLVLYEYCEELGGYVTNLDTQFYNTDVPVDLSSTVQMYSSVCLWSLSLEAVAINYKHE